MATLGVSISWEAFFAGRANAGVEVGGAIKNVLALGAGLSDGLGFGAHTRAALERIYAATGIPNVFYNSSLQLAEVVASCPAIEDLASRCLFLPDYFNYLLSGRLENEFTIASTSQLIDVRSTGWSRTALDYFRIPPRWFTPPLLSGARLGRLRKEITAGAASGTVRSTGPGTK